MPIFARKLQELENGGVSHQQPLFGEKALNDWNLATVAHSDLIVEKQAFFEKWREHQFRFVLLSQARLDQTLPELVVDYRDIKSAYYFRSRGLWSAMLRQWRDFFTTRDPRSVFEVYFPWKSPAKRALMGETVDSHCKG